MSREGSAYGLMTLSYRDSDAYSYARFGCERMEETSEDAGGGVAAAAEGGGVLSGVAGVAGAAAQLAAKPPHSAVELAANAIRRSGSARIRERSIGAVES